MRGADGIRIAFVVAVADNAVIGREGQIPWRQSSDLKLFRKLTLGKPVIMGRKTFQSIGKPLDGRDNIVVSRRKDFGAPGASVVDSVDAAIELGRKLARTRGVEEVAIIGGAEIFAAAMAQADRIYLTLVHGSPGGDTFFEAPDPGSWQETSRTPLPQGPNDQFPAEFIVLDRKS